MAEQYKKQNPECKKEVKFDGISPDFIMKVSNFIFN
jgi:hypothetical protein